MKKSKKIIIALLVLSVVAYIAMNLYIRESDKVTTVYADMATEEKIIEADCFVVRDEVEGSAKNNSALVKNTGEGVYVPYIEDGARVAAGDTIALFFTSQSEAKAYQEKQKLEEKLERYEQLRDQSLLNYIDVDRLDTTIKSEFTDILVDIENNDFSDIDNKLDTLKYNISSRQIAVGEKVDFKTQIENISNQIKELAGSGINYKKIKAKYAGSFISNVDGYESTVDYDSISDMTVTDVEKVINSDPVKVKDNVIGKIVGEYNWYAVCNLPYTAIGDVAVGSKMSVSFKDTAVEKIKMTVVSIETDGETSAVVLKSGIMNSEIANLRKETIQITVEEYTGLKIPKEAVRYQDITVKNEEGKEETVNAMGVYILYGQVVRFRRIDDMYSTDEFVISEYDTTLDNCVSLYDMVITKGRELYDGKIVY